MGVEGWTLTRLGDLVEIKHGWPFKSEFYNEELTGRPIVVGVGNFRYTGGFRFAETQFKEYRGDYPKEFELEPRDTLLIMTCQTPGGEILGIPARVPEDGRVYLHNQRLGRVVVRDSTRVDSSYLYWLFLSPAFNRELVISASGTKILHTSPARIEGFTFGLPPVHEQRAIAHVLGTLDDKIELNRRMNQTLEEMARAIFKSWFVDFEPVRAKMERRETGLPPEVEALFPDRFVESEIGEVPGGWGVAPLSSFIHILSGGTPKRSDPSYWNGEIPWFSVRDTPADSDVFVLWTEEGITQAGVDNSAAQVLPVGTTIITARGTVGKLALVGVPMAMNQSCFGVRGTDCSDVFTYYVLRQAIRVLKQNTHGSVFSTITRATFDSVKVVVPPPEPMRAFAKAADRLFARIRANCEQGYTLAALRDALLPKLISGEVRVPSKVAVRTT
ncbi:MAG TPA: restriction endonuclease subunit S [Candidatus Thermoplasmatota archaeon]|nr:restriction endonuclease subunit S [Candidatus Thermoplasmatota archaeon]